MSFAYPKSTMVPTICFNCLSKEYNVYYTATNHPDYILNCCNNPECIENSKYGMKEFLESREDCINLREKIHNVKVQRSNGEIEKGWVIVSFWITNQDTIPDIVLNSSNGMSSKTLRGEKFLEINPDWNSEKLLNIVKDIYDRHLNQFDGIDFFEKE